MNECIKAIIDEAADVEATVVSVMKKDYTALIPELVKDAMDGKSVVDHLSSLKAEAQALVSDPAADADLLAYVAAKFAGDSSKAAKVIPAAADFMIAMVSKGEALLVAIKS